jgi:purine-binding chemotaxis protein CheW
MALEAAQFVTLGVEKEVFGLPVSLVREILDPCNISQLPQSPAYVLGMIDVRGDTVPVIDLRLKLGLSPSDTGPSTRIIVLELNIDERLLVVGLRVDCVFEVTELDEATLDPPPYFGGKWRSESIAGIGRRGKAFVVVLDFGCLLKDEANMFVSTDKTVEAA